MSAVEMPEVQGFAVRLTALVELAQKVDPHAAPRDGEGTDGVDKLDALLAAMSLELEALHALASGSATATLVSGLVAPDNGEMRTVDAGVEAFSTLARAVANADDAHLACTEQFDLRYTGNLVELYLARKLWPVRPVAAEANRGFCLALAQLLSLAMTGHSTVVNWQTVRDLPDFRDGCAASERETQHG